MARKKLSEVQAKKILHTALGSDYEGHILDTTKEITPQLSWVNASSRYVVKVDEGVKGRYKKGLVKLDVPYDQLVTEITEFKNQGYRWLIIEPHVVHAAAEERYLQLSRTRDGITLLHSTKGGVHVEDSADTVQSHTLNAKTNWYEVAEKTGVHEGLLRKLAHIFVREYMTFLEINPFIQLGQAVHFLDVAAEVDDAGAYFVSGWTKEDFRKAGSHSLTDQERVVQQLDEKSPASFSFTVLNPNGSIFLLLSGGGASVVVADEVYATRNGQKLANYGEYSGNPTADETHEYASAVLDSLLASNAPRKVLFIGGAVANFTDIVNTFSGIIAAITERAAQLRLQGVKIFVRRGGPRQEEGLAHMTQALESQGLLGAVHGPEVPLIAAIDEAMEAVK